jgi:hypothetical protein
VKITDQIIDLICRVGPLQLDDIAQRLSANDSEEHKEERRHEIRKGMEDLRNKEILVQDQFDRWAISSHAVRLR